MKHSILALLVVSICIIQLPTALHTMNQTQEAKYNDAGRTELQEAAYAGDFQQVKKLSKISNIETKDKNDEFNALDYALRGLIVRSLAGADKDRYKDTIITIKHLLEQTYNQKPTLRKENTNGLTILVDTLCKKHLLDIAGYFADSKKISYIVEEALGINPTKYKSIITRLQTQHTLKEKKLNAIYDIVHLKKNTKVTSF